MTKKIKVTDDVAVVYTWDLEGSLKDLKGQVENWITDFGEDAHLDAEWSPEPTTFNIKVDREETDAEYEARMNKERLHTSAVVERERAEFERLQKKFGKVE